MNEANLSAPVDALVANVLETTFDHLDADTVENARMRLAVAIAGRLLGLNRDQMRNAFGIVLNRLGGSFQIIWDGTTSFKLPQGLSARDAIFSAELARAGWTGPKDALLSRCGYYELFTEGCTDQEILTKDLGNVLE